MLQSGFGEGALDEIFGGGEGQAFGAGEAGAGEEGGEARGCWAQEGEVVRLVAGGGG